MIDTKIWNVDYIGEKVIKPMYEDSAFPLELADEIKSAIEKQIPKRPKIDSWSAALCPFCGSQLSELVGDGYYKHYTSEKYCNCGQLLDWSDKDE